MGMDVRDRVKSLLDRKDYRISAMSGDLAVLRPDEGEPILEDLGDLHI